MNTNVERKENFKAEENVDFLLFAKIIILLKKKFFFFF